MPRANRHYIPGYIWHITHRCHKREFLLKFAKDKQCWMRWLFEAKKRYKLNILDYMVTSNHIHLLVSDDGGRDTIPSSIQLIAGRTGQEYNERKKRKGAFWEDRYHATAIEKNEHLIQCMVYIDMNIVRAGVKENPMEWPFCGYYEIQRPRKRYGLINYQRLMELLGMKNFNEVQESCRERANEAIRIRNLTQDSKWTESIAVGSEGFVAATKEKLGIRAKNRQKIEENKTWYLRENIESYRAHFMPENDVLRPENIYFWTDIP